MAATAATSSFIGTRLPEVHSGSGRVQARFGFGTKKSPPKRAASKTVPDRPLWYPGAKAPEYLDGSLSTPFQPYSEVFGLQRFRECELIHGRWAMLATLVPLIELMLDLQQQNLSYVNYFKQVELVEGSSYLGQPLPFSITTLIWIEALVIGYIEFQRNAELDPEKRLYPVQAAATGKGPLNNWATHLSDPLHTTILDTFGLFS
ncbi:hypothetical protein Pfo_029915 [Paulownia fortunei]|nr:hypothetical protein Pfo_029915 [Paulownia fortunei]